MTWEGFGAEHIGLAVEMVFQWSTKSSSPNSVDTLGVLTVVEKLVCLDRCAARACAANSLLFYESQPS